MNKINTKQLFSLCFSLLIVLTGCSENEIVEQSYLKLSENSFTFEPEGRALTIKVEANPAWSIVPDAEYDWLTETERGADFITFTAADNIETKSRSASFTVTAGIHSETLRLDQLPGEPTLAKYRLLNKFLSTTISLNGRYIGGCVFEMNNEGDVYSIVKVDLETGEEVVLEKTNEPLDVRLISNTGIVVVYSDDLSCCEYYTATGERRSIELPEGCRSPYVNGLNGDGSVMVGRVIKDNIIPAKWVNGQVELLPVPETAVDGDVLWDPVEARGCSEDGSVIYGGVMNVESSLYWKNGKVQYAGEDVVNPNATISVVLPFFGERELPYIEGLYTRTKGLGISPNGRYITAYYGFSENKKERNLPAIFDTETETTTIINDFPDSQTRGGEAIGVTNEGDVFFGTFEMTNTLPLVRILDRGYVYEHSTQQSITTSEYLKKDFGITLLKKNALIKIACTDQKTFYGYNLEIGPLGYVADGWYIKLSE